MRCGGKSPACGKKWAGKQAALSKRQNSGGLWASEVHGPLAMPGCAVRGKRCDFAQKLERS